MAGRQSYRSRWEQLFRQDAHASGVTRGAIGTGLMMQTYANADGTSITVSQGTLARQQGVTTRTIRSDLRNLEGAGWIQTVTRGSGPGHPSEHRLAIPAADFLPTPSINEERRKFASPKAEVSRHQGGSELPTTMGTMEPRTTPYGVVRIGEPVYLRMVRFDEMNAWEKHDHARLGDPERAEWHALIDAEADLP